LSFLLVIMLFTRNILRVDYKKLKNIKKIPFIIDVIMHDIQQNYKQIEKKYYLLWKIKCLLLTWGKKKMISTHENLEFSSIIL